MCGPYSKFIWNHIFHRDKIYKNFELGFLLFKHDLETCFHLMLTASWMVTSQWLNIWKLKQISLLMLVLNLPTNRLVSFILWTYIQQSFWSIEKHVYIENHLGHGKDWCCCVRLNMYICIKYNHVCLIKSFKLTQSNS
jgi:hypothetical protein